MMHKTKNVSHPSLHIGETGVICHLNIGFIKTFPDQIEDASTACCRYNGLHATSSPATSPPSIHL